MIGVGWGVAAFTGTLSAEEGNEDRGVSTFICERLVSAVGIGDEDTLVGTNSNHIICGVGDVVKEGCGLAVVLALPAAKPVRPKSTMMLIPNLPNRLNIFLVELDMSIQSFKENKCLCLRQFRECSCLKLQSKTFRVSRTKAP